MSNLVQPFCPLPPATIWFARVCPSEKQLHHIDAAKNKFITSLVEKVHGIAQKVYEAFPSWNEVNRLPEILPSWNQICWGVAGGVAGGCVVKLFSGKRPDRVAPLNKPGGGDAGGGPGDLPVQETLNSAAFLSSFGTAFLGAFRESLQEQNEASGSLLEALRKKVNIDTRYQYQQFNQRNDQLVQDIRDALIDLQAETSRIEESLHEFESEAMRSEEGLVNGILTLDPFFSIERGPMVTASRQVQELPLGSLRTNLKQGGFVSFRGVPKARSGDSLYATMAALWLQRVSQGIMPFSQEWMNQRLPANPNGEDDALRILVLNTLTSLQQSPESLEGLLRNSRVMIPLIALLRRHLGRRIGEQDPEWQQQWRNELAVAFRPEHTDEIRNEPIERLIERYATDMGTGATVRLLPILSSILHLPVALYSLHRDGTASYTMPTTIQEANPFGYVIHGHNHFFLGQLEEPEPPIEQKKSEAPEESKSPLKNQDLNELD